MNFVQGKNLEQPFHSMSGGGGLGILLVKYTATTRCDSLISNINDKQNEIAETHRERKLWSGADSEVCGRVIMVWGNLPSPCN